MYHEEAAPGQAKYCNLTSDWNQLAVSTMYQCMTTSSCDMVPASCDMCPPSIYRSNSTWWHKLLDKEDQTYSPIHHSDVATAALL